MGDFPNVQLSSVAARRFQIIGLDSKHKREFPGFTHERTFGGKEAKFGQCMDSPQILAQTSKQEVSNLDGILGRAHDDIW
jgi:hypothetical protein